MEKEILAKVAAYQTDMWKFIEKIVNIDSGSDSPEGVEEIAHLIGDFLEPLGFEVEYHKSNGPVQLIAKRPNPGKAKILIMGHMDTVFGKGTVAARPFKIENGIAYGPGVMDMKSGLAMGIFTIKAMLDCGYDDAEFSVYFTGDEEGNHVHSDAREMFALHGKGLTAAFNMEPGRDNGDVVYGRKGIWRPTIVVDGIPTHAGNAYKEGASAILELAKKTVDLFNVTDYNTGITCNVGTFHGGTVNNIIAAHAEAMLDVRFETVAEAELAKEKVLAVCAKPYDERTKITVVDNGVVDYMGPFETTEAGMKLFKYVQKIANDLGQGELGGQFVGGASDACFTTDLGTPTICGMGPKSVGAHTDNEYAYVDSYLPRCELLATAIMRINEM